jgi:hypothetical protein
MLTMEVRLAVDGIKGACDILPVWGSFRLQQSIHFNHSYHIVQSTHTSDRMQPLEEQSEIVLVLSLTHVSSTNDSSTTRNFPTSNQPQPPPPSNQPSRTQAMTASPKQDSILNHSLHLFNLSEKLQCYRP